jgi:predicted ATPase/DNA-binding SARP family transcriptional activator
VIEVLGPLRVCSAGEAIDVGSARHREVLAALVVDAGRIVSVDTLLERVWGDARRGASPSNLHAVISRLRGRLQAHPGIVISTAAPGYRLEAPDTIDAVIFQERVVAAQGHHFAGDLDAARVDLEVGLALWRDRAYTDIGLPFVELEAARLDSLRVGAWELLVDVQLGLGRLGEALGRLPALVAEHPLRETFRRQLMHALYRSGRQAEALEVYADLRRVLSEELGLDPGPAVQDLHRRILAQDEDLVVPVRPAAPESAAPADPIPGHAVPDGLAAHASGQPPAGTSGPALWHSDVVVPADDLIGRERDVEYLRDLLITSPQRVVTVTGVGGVGKTRLAHAVAQAARDGFPGGVAITSLVAVTDARMVVPTIGRALGLTGVEGQGYLDAVVEHLRERRALLVVDNFEHLLDAAADLAHLVATCPRLSILVTSRSTLRVRAELQYQVAPLSLPGPDASSPDALASASAVALFVQRARSSQPGFELDADNAHAVAGICRRLGGIPLALELAAARAHLMSPTEILERLERVMAATGARDLPARQRTMQSAIDWSYQLLQPHERRLFRRLSVFVDGFTLEAVEAVHPDRDVDVLTAVESLASHSLVLRDLDHPQELRFRMLEPVAQFAASRLEGEEARAARDAHLHHFLGVVEEVAVRLRGRGTREALALTKREQANLTGAIDWALESGQAELAGRAAWAMWLFWWARGHVLEGRRLCEATLSQDLSGPVRARVIAAAGAMAFAQGDFVGAACWSDGASLSREIGDLEAEAHNVAGEGLVAMGAGDLEEAEDRFLGAVALTEQVGLEGQWLWTLAHVWLATLRVLAGVPADAEPLLDKALAAARVREDPLATYITLFTSAQVALTAGDLALARRQLSEGITLSLDTGDMANLAYFLEALAVVEAQDGDLDTVVLLHGAAQHLRETVGSNVYAYYRPDETLLAATLETAERELGPAYDSLLARGRQLGLDDTVALAQRTSTV